MAPLRPRGRLVYPGRYVKAYYNPNRKSIARCAVGPLLAHAVHDIAERKAKPFAIQHSPQETGEYKDSFLVEQTLTGLTPEAIGHPPMLRVCARLWNLAARVSASTGEVTYYAAAVEWGNRATPKGHRVLGKTLDALNGALRDG